MDDVLELLALGVGGEALFEVVQFAVVAVAVLVVVAAVVGLFLATDIGALGLALTALIAVASAGVGVVAGMKVRAVTSRHMH